LKHTRYTLQPIASNTNVCGCQTVEYNAPKVT